MRLARMILAGALAAAIGSAAWAQQALTGTVTLINRLDGTIAIQQTQPGTVGANGGAAQSFKAQGAMLEALHAGDKVTFSVSDTNGAKTITKIDKQ